jgi:hypothetical protein
LFRKQHHKYILHICIFCHYTQKGKVERVTYISKNPNEFFFAKYIFEKDLTHYSLRAIMHLQPISRSMPWTGFAISGRGFDLETDRTAPRFNRCNSCIQIYPPFCMEGGRVFGFGSGLAQPPTLTPFM